MSVFKIGNKKYHWNKKRRICCIIVVEAVVFLVAVAIGTGLFTAKDYWVIEGAGQTLSVLATEEEANEAIDLISSKYTKKNATDVTVKLDPILEVKKKYYGKLDEKPSVATAKETADAITVSSKNESPLVDIVTTQTVSKESAVEFDTVYQKSEQAALNTTAVKTKGEDGVKTRTVKTTSENGKLLTSKVLSTKTEKKATNQVVLKGTKTGEAAKGTTTTNLGSDYSLQCGEALVKYAKQFLGNPYVYGGSSLTNGADCSGFVMALYAHYGIQLPHDAGADRAYGKEVSLSDAQPGDLICYYGHIGIYIGNNQIIHAMNEQNGITISTIGYNGKSVLTVRRIFG